MATESGNANMITTVTEAAPLETTTSHPEPDRSEPSDERKAELRGAYQEGSDAPYAGVQVRTLGELTWICSERGWSGAFELPEGMARPNFVKATLNDATLTGADLNDATLTGALLNGAMLTGANLQEARFTDADLRGADLSGANLARASLNSGTTPDRVKFTGAPPRCLGVRWNGAPLDGVDWSQITRLGDEATIAKAKSPTERVQAYRDAARAYHGLIVALEQQGLTEPARRFRVRERLMERRALRARVQTWPAFAFYWLLNLISGQGEAPERILAAYLVVISSFTGLYWWMSHTLVTSSKPLKWYEALVLSLSSFHGRGFFPSQIGLGDPLAIVAACEAVIGLFIELILIATFSKRFLNS